VLNVLLSMADFAEDDGGDIFPGIELLAAKSRVSVRTAQEALRQLEEDEVIEQMTSTRGGRGHITEYRIDLERVQELQGLHEVENRDCRHCLAKRKSAEKRAQHRARRVQLSEKKGAASRQKGAIPREPIDNTHQQPSEHPSHPRARDVAGASSKKQPASAWPEIWTAFSGWPGASPDWPEERARHEWTALGDNRPPDQDLILCIRAHGRWLAETNARRGKSAGNQIPASPHRWLQDRRFKGYLDAARASVLTALDDATKRPMVLPDDVIARIERSGISRAQIDGYFREATFSGAPPRFAIPSSFARNWITTHFLGRMRREFGDALEIVDQPKREAA
jgi:ribosomal protein L20A (L18A)